MYHEIGRNFTSMKIADVDSDEFHILIPITLGVC